MDNLHVLHLYKDVRFRFRRCSSVLSIRHISYTGEVVAVTTLIDRTDCVPRCYQRTNTPSLSKRVIRPTACTNNVLRYLLLVVISHGLLWLVQFNVPDTLTMHAHYACTHSNCPGTIIDMVYEVQ